MEEEAEAGGQQRAPRRRSLQLGACGAAQLGHPRRPGGVAGQGGALARQGCNSVDIILGTSPNLSLIMSGVLRHVLTCSALVLKSGIKPLGEGCKGP